MTILHWSRVAQKSFLVLNSVIVKTLVLVVACVAVALLAFTEWRAPQCGRMLRDLIVPINCSNAAGSGKLVMSHCPIKQVVSGPGPFQNQSIEATLLTSILEMKRCIKDVTLEDGAQQSAPAFRLAWARRVINTSSFQTEEMAKEDSAEEVWCTEHWVCQAASESAPNQSNPDEMRAFHDVCGEKNPPMIPAELNGWPQWPRPPVRNSDGLEAIDFDSALSEGDDAVELGSDTAAQIFREGHYEINGTLRVEESMASLAQAPPQSHVAVRTSNMRCEGQVHTWTAPEDSGWERITHNTRSEADTTGDASRGSWNQSDAAYYYTTQWKVGDRGVGEVRVRFFYIAYDMDFKWATVLGENQDGVVRPWAGGWQLWPCGPYWFQELQMGNQTVDDFPGRKHELFLERLQWNCLVACMLVLWLMMALLMVPVSVHSTPCIDGFFSMERFGIAVSGLLAMASCLCVHVIIEAVGCHHEHCFHFGLATLALMLFGLAGLATLRVRTHAGCRSELHNGGATQFAQKAFGSDSNEGDHNEADNAAASLARGEALHRRVPPERWCVTRADFLTFVRIASRRWLEGGVPDSAAFPNQGHKDPRIGPSMYQVNDYVIKPVTRNAGGVSWALMCHEEGLQCDLFVSHAWAEGLFEFAGHLQNSWPFEARTMWCCFLANPQCLDISELLDVPVHRSPFAKALDAATHFIVLPNSAKSIYTRLWCVYEIWEAACRDKEVVMPDPTAVDLAREVLYRYSPYLLSYNAGSLILTAMQMVIGLRRYDRPGSISKDGSRVAGLCFYAALVSSVAPPCVLSWHLWRYGTGLDEERWRRLVLLRVWIPMTGTFLGAAAILALLTSLPPWAVLHGVHWEGTHGIEGEDAFGLGVEWTVVAGNWLMDVMDPRSLFKQPQHGLLIACALLTYWMRTLQDGIEMAATIAPASTLESECARFIFRPLLSLYLALGCLILIGLGYQPLTQVRSSAKQCRVHELAWLLENAELFCLLLFLTGHQEYHKVRGRLEGQLQHTTVKQAECSSSSDHERIMQAIRGKEAFIDEAIDVLVRVGVYDASVVEARLRGTKLQDLRVGPLEVLLPHILWLCITMSLWRSTIASGFAVASVALAHILWLLNFHLRCTGSWRLLVAARLYHSMRWHLGLAVVLLWYAGEASGEEELELSSHSFASWSAVVSILAWPLAPLLDGLWQGYYGVLYSINMLSLFFAGLAMLAAWARGQDAADTHAYLDEKPSFCQAFGWLPLVVVASLCLFYFVYWRYGHRLSGCARMMVILLVVLSGFPTYIFGVLCSVELCIELFVLWFWAPPEVKRGQVLALFLAPACFFLMRLWTFRSIIKQANAANHPSADSLLVADMYRRELKALMLCLVSILGARAASSVVKDSGAQVVCGMCAYFLSLIFFLRICWVLRLDRSKVLDRARSTSRGSLRQPSVTRLLGLGHFRRILQDLPSDSLNEGDSSMELEAASRTQLLRAE